MLALVTQEASETYPLTRLLRYMNSATIATTTRMPPMDMAATMCITVLNAQMIGPASKRIATTIIHVGKFWFVWVATGVLSISEGRVAVSQPRQQERSSPLPCSDRITGAPLTDDNARTETPGPLVRRIGAHLLDAALLFVLLSLIWSIAAPFVSLTFLPYVNTAIVVVYAVWMESTRGQTLGKQVLRLRVRGQDGDTPSLGQAFRRNLYFLLAILPGFIGGLITLGVIGWIATAIHVDTAHRQGVHDRFANQTFVTQYPRT